MHLETEADVMPLGEGRVALPVWKHPLVPLPRDDLLKVVRPSAGHPVRVAGSRRIARAAAEEVDHRHLELLGQLDRAPVDLVACGGDLRTRMKRVAMAGQRRDLQAA